MSSTRDHAIEIFHHTLDHSTLAAAATQAIHCDQNTLHIRNQQIPLTPIKKIFLIALGKGAAPLFDTIRNLLPPHIPIHSVISAPTAPASLTPADKYFQGGHPQPNAASIAAAQAALHLLSTAHPATLVLFLITGGASAMFESPISPQISLEDLIQLNRLLVSSGAPISEINTVRKHLSAVKGGRLALALAPEVPNLTLLVSDVPANALDSLASGPTLADPSTVADTLAVLDRYHLRNHLPESIRRQLDHLPETPKKIPQHDSTQHPPVVLLDNSHLIHQAAAHARSLGFEVHIDNSTDDWDATRAAHHLLNRLRQIPPAAKPICLIAGGELTVSLPHDLSSKAAGGRNQHFVLACALNLNPNENITILSAGSDGIDGNSPAAGAVADQTTIPRAAALGLNPQSHLEAFNSYALFQSLGDAITTGPTNNNLRDLRILIRQ